ncbi:MAG: universal stress protein [Candidatus Korarchaeota archaeon]|nr:universal stress protein [Candidatus Korarchaeota archaeon]
MIKEKNLKPLLAIPMVVHLRKVLLPLGDKTDVHEIVAALSQLEGEVELVLFHVIKMPITTPLEVEVKAPKWLNEIAERLRERGMAVKVIVAEARDVADAIVEEAEEGKYDLILMFKRKRKGLKHVLTRSISGRVAKATKRPVMTILKE